MGQVVPRREEPQTSEEREPRMSFKRTRVIWEITPEQGQPRGTMSYGSPSGKENSVRRAAEAKRSGVGGPPGPKPPYCTVSPRARPVRRRSSQTAFDVLLLTSGFIVTPSMETPIAKWKLRERKHAKLPRSWLGPPPWPEDVVLSAKEISRGTPVASNSEQDPTARLRNVQKK